MARKILDIATFGLAGAIFGKKKKKAPEPMPETPSPMPMPDDNAVMRARRRGIIQQRSRRGRDSTILTGTTLGG